MAIEGPLRELGIHDVFQLLDLSRKTGALRVTSGLRDDEGTVYFEGGQVVYATLRSNSQPLGAMLVQAGRLTEEELERARARQHESGGARRLGDVLVELGLIPARELERQLRRQVEAVIFELLSWHEGFFSFVEQSVADVPAEASVRMSAESLLMEGARRTDEWSAISDRVPSIEAVPSLATSDQQDWDPAAPLDLRLEEWELLTAVDGERDLRGVAATLGRSEFDVAKIAAQLVRSRVIELITPRAVVAERGSMAGLAQAERAMTLLGAGDVEGALAEARLGIAADPTCVPAHLAAARALERLGRIQESMEELRRATQLDPRNPAVQRALGFAAARAGQLGEAITCWQLYLHDAEAGAERQGVEEAMDAAVRLRAAVEAHAWR